MAVPFRFAVPWTGRLSEGLDRIENVRGLNGARALNAQDARWIDREFPQADAPTLNIGTADLPWYARSFFTMNIRGWASVRPLETSRYLHGFFSVTTSVHSDP